MSVTRVWPSKYHHRITAALKRYWMIGVGTPRRSDYWIVSCLLALQVLLLVFAAVSGFLLRLGSEAVGAEVENPGFLGFFVHNSLAFLLWALGGAVTFGLVAHRLRGG